jgi:hypothetical protein
MMQPFQQYEVSQGKQKKKFLLGSYILQNSLKRSNDVQKFVAETCAGLEQKPWPVSEWETEAQLRAGQWLKEFGHRALPIELMYCAKQGYGSLEQSLKECHTFNQRVTDAGLWDFHLRRPLLDGKTLCDLYEIKPGKIMKPLLEEQLKFEILNPRASQEDCKVYMQANKALFLAKYN